jgi:hypothetical protein
MAPTWRLKLTMSKVVEIGDMEVGHAQARQGQQVDTADAAAAGDGDALAAQDCCSAGVTQPILRENACS